MNYKRHFLTDLNYSYLEMMYELGWLQMPARLRVVTMQRMVIDTLEIDYDCEFGNFIE